MRIDLTVLAAVPLAVLLGCGSPDESEKMTADETTGAESSKAGDTAGASAEAGVAGASNAGTSGAGSHAGASGTGSRAGASGANASGAGASGAGASGAGASGAGANASGAGTSGANASGAGASGAGASGAGASGAGAAGNASSATCDPSCPDGQHCELVQVMCIRAPCPPLPMCVAAPAATSCDPAKILCKRAVPECPQGQVPSVDGSCYGPCVPVESCGCSNESECPNHDSYTCWRSAKHCGPYV